MRLILRAVDAMNVVLTGIVGVLLMVIAAAVFGQVMVRFVLTAVGINISAPWTEELARYTLVWVVFLGAAVGCRKAQLIALEFVVMALPSVPGQVLRYATLVLCIGFFALLVQVGIPFWELGKTETSPVMRVQKSWVYLAMPVGCSLMILNTLALMLQAAVERRDIRGIGGTTGTE